MRTDGFCHWLISIPAAKREVSKARKRFEAHRLEKPSFELKYAPAKRQCLNPSEQFRGSSASCCYRNVDCDMVHPCRDRKNLLRLARLVRRSSSRSSRAGKIKRSRSGPAKTSPFQRRAIVEYSVSNAKTPGRVEGSRDLCRARERKGAETSPTGSWMALNARYGHLIIERNSDLSCRRDTGYHEGYCRFRISSNRLTRSSALKCV